MFTRYYEEKISLIVGVTMSCYKLDKLASICSSHAFFDAIIEKRKKILRNLFIPDPPNRKTRFFL